MKWFFALNEESADFANYAKMVKVAVHTALQNTRLEAFFVYDGSDNELTEWLRARDVKVIRHRSFLYSRLKTIAEKRNDPNFLHIGAGAFLRTEIPNLTFELGIMDRYVLYTDVDVMFMRDVSGLCDMAPKFFAVAPESSISDYRGMNSGVMLMNLDSLRRDDPKFRAFMLAEIDSLIDNSWDQGAYSIFYQGRFFGYRWNKLPVEYNWKTYWQENPDARIIHFHGPKPYQRDLLASAAPPEHLRPLLSFLTDNYLKLSTRWDELYREVDAAS